MLRRDVHRGLSHFASGHSARSTGALESTGSACSHLEQHHDQRGVHATFSVPSGLAEALRSNWHLSKGLHLEA